MKLIKKTIAFVESLPEPVNARLWRIIGFFAWVTAVFSGCSIGNFLFCHLAEDLNMRILEIVTINALVIGVVMVGLIIQMDKSTSSQEK